MANVTPAQTLAGAEIEQTISSLNAAGAHLMAHRCIVPRAKTIDQSLRVGSG